MTALLLPPQGSGETPNPVLTAQHVQKSYGDGHLRVKVLDGINLEVGRSQFTAVLGSSGSGKSTLLHCLGALDRVSSGTVLLGSSEIQNLSDDKLSRLRRDHFGFLFQSFDLLPGISVSENLVLPSRLAGTKILPGRLSEVIKRTGVEDLLDRTPAGLSGTEQQLVAIARALLGSPQVFFADEPTGNLDSEGADQVLSLLRSAVDEMGHTILLATHNPRVAGSADRVVLLSDGQIVGELENPSPADVLTTLAQLESQEASKPDRPSPIPVTPTPPTPEPELPAPPAPQEAEIPLPSVPRSVGIPEGPVPLGTALDEIAPQQTLSPRAAEVVNRATSILEHLEGPIISSQPGVERTPHTDE